VEAADQTTASLPARTSLLGNDLAQRHQRNGTQPYAVVDGIAVIEISGTLVHRGAWIGQSSGLTSYEGIAAQLQTALADPGVRGIALEIDSFGGEVAGAFDLADRIRAARAQKPVQPDTVEIDPLHSRFRGRLSPKAISGFRTAKRAKAISGFGANSRRAMSRI